MINFDFATLLVASVLSIPGIIAFVPELYPVERIVTARRGSNVALVCLGSHVDQFDTVIKWTFNAHEVKTGGNRRIVKKWPSGRFSLHISNVSEKDAGEYQCIAEVSDFGDVDKYEALIKLQLYKSVLDVSTSRPNIILGEGSTTSIQCEVTCSEAMEVWTFWLFNGEMIEAEPFHGGNDQVLSNKVKNASMILELKHVTLAQSGTYTCGANSTGILRTRNISVTVQDAEGPTVVNTENIVEVSKGKNAALSCVAAYPPASFVDTFWIFNDSRIYSNNKYKESNAWFELSQGHVKKRKLRLMIYNVGLDDSGVYTCVLNTSHGLRQKNVSVHVRMETTHNNGNETTPSYSVSDEKENADLLGTTLFIGLGLFVGLLTTTIVSLKFWRKRRLRPPESIKFSADVDERDFTYDVFITYSRKDFSWVDQELLPLFNNNEVKYCVDHLHFELGKAFLENMAEGIYKSRKVLAVWSANYASSKFCKQELDYALQRSFEKGDSALIVIRLDGTDRKRLPKLLRARTFLDYADSVERKGWGKRLIKHLKAPTQKSQSIGTMV